MRGNVVTGCGLGGGGAAAATVVALPPDCLTPAEKLDHMWSKEHSWTAYPSIGGGPISLQPASPGNALFLDCYEILFSGEILTPTLRYV